MAGVHAQLFPDADQVFFFYPQQVDTLPAGDFHHRDGVFVGDIGNAAQLGGIGYAALHLGNDGERAVFLDVGVGAFVDKPALRVVFGFFRPA